MKTRIQRWGNSLAIRIPKAFAEEIHLFENTDVDIDLQEDSLVVRRPRRKKYDLEQLLSQITPENRYPETDWGDDVGKEIPS